MHVCIGDINVVFRQASTKISFECKYEAGERNDYVLAIQYPVVNWIRAASKATMAQIHGTELAERLRGIQDGPHQRR